MTNRIKTTQIVATALMKKYGLIEKGWRFGLDRAKTRCGICDYDAKLISISRLYIQDSIVPFDDIKNTILHEIAHALAGNDAAHGPVWKQVARSIGCNGNTYNNVWKGAPMKYRIHCDCGAIDIRRHKVAPKFQRGICKYCKTLEIAKLPFAK
jgi:predicted SprT family Zn-dependent metalloprotease